LVRERLRALPPAPGERVLEYPVELRGFRSWRAVRGDPRREWETLQALVRIAGLPALQRPLSALVLGSGTGFFCHRLHGWGFSPVAGVEEDAEQLAVARIVDGYLHADSTTYAHSDYEDHLLRGGEGTVDVTFASRSFADS